MCRDPKIYQKSAQRQKVRRLNPLERATFILVDSRREDKKKNRDNDLTKEYIQELIDNGCFYCGRSNHKMTLDRVDNQIGHMQTNVVPSCIQCNYIRRDMPWEAWLIVSKSVKEVIEQNLLEGWKAGA